MKTWNSGLSQGAGLMLIASLIFIGYAVVFFFRTVAGGAGSKRHGARAGMDCLSHKKPGARPASRVSLSGSLLIAAASEVISCERSPTPAADDVQPKIG